MRAERPDNNQGCVIFFIGYACSIVLQVILSFSPLEGGTFLWTYSFLVQAIFLGATLIGFGIYRISPVKTLGLKRGISLSQGLLIIPIALFSLLAFGPLATLFSKLLSLMGYNYTPTYADYTSSGGAFALGIFGLCIMPAFGEEFLVRGALASGLKGKSYAHAIFLSALLFALMHSNAVQLVHQFAIGVIMAYLVILTGSIYPSIFFHFLNNLVAISVDLALAKSSFIKGLSASFLALPEVGIVFIYLAMALVGIVITFLLVYIYVKVSIKRYVKGGGHYVPPTEKGIKGIFATFSHALEVLDDSRAEAMFVRGEKEVRSPGLYISVGFMVLVWLLNVVSVWVS